MFRALATRGASAFRGATMQVSLVKRVFDSIVGIWTLDIDFLTICNLSAGASRPGCTFCETYELLSRIRCRVWREVCKILVFQISEPKGLEFQSPDWHLTLTLIALGTLPTSTEQISMAGRSERFIVLLIFFRKKLISTHTICRHELWVLKS